MPLRYDASQQPNADRLPTELLEIFFKHLDHGTLTKEYLSACSRVSRRWRAIALPLLFRAVRVRFHVDDDGGSNREHVVFPPSMSSSYARTDAGVLRGYDSVSSRRRIGTGKGRTRTNRNPTTSQTPGKTWKTLNSMHAFFARNHQFATYVHELQLILVCPEQNTGEHGSTSLDAGSGSSSVQYPFADPDELLAVLHTLPHLRQLKLYDVALTGHPTSNHRAVNLQLLRLQFPNRAAEITDLVHYQALFSLFDFVDELWVGHFGDGLSFPGSMSSLVPVPTRARLVHMQPSESLLYPMIAKGLASFSGLEHVELNGFADPFKPHLDYAPQDTVNPVVKCDENVLSFIMTVADDNPGLPARRCLELFRHRQYPNKTLMFVTVQRPFQLFTLSRDDLRAAAARVVTHLRSLASKHILPQTTTTIVSWDRDHGHPKACCAEIRHLPDQIGVEQEQIISFSETVERTIKEASHLLSGIAEYVHVVNYPTPPGNI